jgi:hypothetical protein
MSEWWTNLDAMLDQVWLRLRRGVADRKAPSRYLVLATAGQTGGAEARMVVLRGADRAEGTVTAHTDTLSAKVAELRADPRATLLLWDPKALLQVRLKVEVGIDTGTVVGGHWRGVPEPARRVYGGMPPPGDVLLAPEGLVETSAQDRFAVMTCKIRTIDALHLSAPRHHRAQYHWQDGWRGRWIAP